MANTKRVYTYTPEQLERRAELRRQRYADRLGFGAQRYGAAITAVIDPGEEGPKRIAMFADLGEAAEFLTWKRSRE